MVVWIPATLLTKPVGLGQITEFYKRVRPYGFWGPVRRLNPHIRPVTKLRHDLGMWGLGIALVYSATFGVGSLVLGNLAWGAGLIALSAVLLGWTIRQVRRAPDGVAE